LPITSTRDRNCSHTPEARAADAFFKPRRGGARPILVEQRLANPPTFAISPRACASWANRTTVGVTPKHLRSSELGSKRSNRRRIGRQTSLAADQGRWKRLETVRGYDRRAKLFDQHAGGDFL
jgi:hypothetical protein